MTQVASLYFSLHQVVCLEIFPVRSLSPLLRDTARWWILRLFAYSTHCLRPLTTTFFFVIINNNIASRCGYVLCNRSALSERVPARQAYLYNRTHLVWEFLALSFKWSLTKHLCNCKVNIVIKTPYSETCVSNVNSEYASFYNNLLPYITQLRISNLINQMPLLFCLRRSLFKLSKIKSFSACISRTIKES